jgi:hypothetical protein
MHLFRGHKAGKNGKDAPREEDKRGRETEDHFTATGLSSQRNNSNLFRYRAQHSIKT